MHPYGDNIKVRVGNADEFGFGADSKGVETGIVEAVPKFEDIIAYGMHSFAFESSWMDEPKLKRLLEKMKKLVGKRIWWESYQDRGRLIKTEVDSKEVRYVFLKMSDIMCYSDNTDVEGKLVEDERSGSFKI